jgi:hypothetical protein
MAKIAKIKTSIIKLRGYGAATKGKISSSARMPGDFSFWILDFRLFIHPACLWD